MGPWARNVGIGLAYISGILSQGWPPEPVGRSVDGTSSQIFGWVRGEGVRHVVVRRGALPYGILKPQSRVREVGESFVSVPLRRIICIETSTLAHTAALIQRLHYSLSNFANLPRVSELMKATLLAQALILMVVLVGTILVLNLVNATANDPVHRTPSDLHNSAAENTPGTVVGTLTLTPTGWLPLVMNNWCPPAIEFTFVPPYGSFDNPEGRVECVDPTDYKVAVYIFVSGWWTKPTFANPLTYIQPDGTWITDITTGGSDQNATKIVAYLVPNSYNPPLMRGGQAFPKELFENSVALVMVEREAVFRRIEFSGYTWKVKASKTLVGPGPNYFSDRVEDVWVDGNGRLHLRIVQRGGRWYSTEVFTEVPLGYGKYIFHIASRVDQLDRNIVLGLFTWDTNAPEHHYREIDIEFSKWGQADNENAQYVVQPWDRVGNRYRFNMELRGDESTHGFDWRIDRIFFQSLYDHQPFPGSEEDDIESWTYRGHDIPPAGEGNARINLWLLSGNPPSDGEEAEVVIEEFDFVPQPE